MAMIATRTCIVLFVVAVALGPAYTAPGYSAVSNVISELAGQHTPGRLVMVAAFVALGAAVGVDGLRARRTDALPFVAFGLCFAAAGMFGHKPFVAGVAYTAWVDTLHSALATVSGVALTVGFVWQALRAQNTRHRALAWALAAWCVVLPLLMLQSPANQGIIQRIMYLAVFAWLWLFYPGPMHLPEDHASRQGTP
jgi:hypothetical protein